MLRICHLTSVHDSSDIRIFRKECVSLANAGYSTYLIAPGDSREEKGVHIIGAGPKPDSRIKRITKFVRTVYKRAVEIDADVYHLHDPELLLIALLLKKNNKKVIFDSHEFYVLKIKEKHYLPAILASMVSSLYSAFESYLYNRIDAVIYPCTDRKILRRWNYQSRLLILDNVPLLDELYVKYRDVPKHNGRTVCLVGSLSYERGITHTIKAVDKAGARLELAGSFVSDAYREEITAMEEYRSVNYHGSINREQVCELLQGANAGISIELDQGQNHIVNTLPTKTYEYMSLGLPVIIHRFPYCEEVMENYKFGIMVDADQVDSICEAIKYVLDHPAQAIEMGQEGRRAIKEQYNWTREEKKLLNLYGNLQENRL